MGSAGYVGHVETRGIYRVLVGKVEGKRPLGRPRHSWKDITKMDLQEVWRESIDLIYWLRIGTCGGLCECGNEASGSIKCGEFLDCLRTC